jgi:phosphoserine phosphatase RsbU/P
MPSWTHKLLERIGPLEKALFLLLALYGLFAAARPSSGWTALLLLLSFGIGMLVLFRIARRGIHSLIWRLRNRLIVAYLFIAVVPVLLVLALVGITTYAVIGQMAVYLVDSELTRRTNALVPPAEALTRTKAAEREDMVHRIAPMIRSRFANFELLVSGEDEDVRFPEGNQVAPPPEGWKNSSGLVRRDKRVYAWAHVTGNGGEVTLMVPLTHDALSSLVPGLGDVNLLNYNDRSRLDRVPPPANAFDFQVSMPYPVQVAAWSSPGAMEDNALIVSTRLSAVLSTVFGQRFQWSEIAFGAFVAVAILFLIVELIALVTGIKLSRTITGAVHGLYQGTQRVKVGDFTHRIPVEGNDQLAELSASFNTMTENLERLIVVAKEKERLQSELAIAREVQDQLFPKSVPQVTGIEISGVCNPARMVSGDYYDFIALSTGALAFAIGDVVGKGISAALLMAAIQSAMRTQLTAGVPVAATAGNGGGHAHVSTAAVVSELNRQLYANTAPEKYATFFFGVYDSASTTLTYTNAGHLPPMILRTNGAVELLEVTGTVVGAFPGSAYLEQRVDLALGDILVAYTDGIVEPENVYGEAFGEDRLKDILVKHSRTDSTELITRIMEAVTEWTGSSELFDDMTMVIARRV